MVELAIVLPILLLVLFAVIQFGLAFWSYQQVSAAASEGARRAAVSRSISDRDGAIAQAARQASPNLDPAQMNVTSSSTWLAGSPVTVTVTYPANVTILGRVFYDGQLTSARTARVEQ